MTGFGTDYTSNQHDTDLRIKTIHRKKIITKRECIDYETRDLTITHLEHLLCYIV